MNARTREGKHASFLLLVTTHGAGINTLTFQVNKPRSVKGSD